MLKWLLTTLLALVVFTAVMPWITRRLGIGNIPGAMIGGLFLGEIESVGPILFLEGLGVPSPSQLKDVVAFTLLVLVLVFRPQGILGERLSRARA